MRIILTLLLLFGLAPLSAVAAPLKAVASFSVLGDIVAKVGGERVTVTTLAGPGADPHEFEPTPANARTMKEADVVFANGLGFDGWFAKLAKSSGFKGAIIASAAKVKTREGGEEEHDHDAKAKDGHAHENEAVDPHVWNAPLNGVSIAQTVRDALIEKDAEGAEIYRANAAALEDELRAIDTDARRDIAAVPEARRRVLTAHESLGYFGDAYGVTLLSPTGLSTAEATSAKDLAKLITSIRKEKVSAYFIEGSANPKLVEQVARATGAQFGGELYVESLSEATGPAESYTAMLRHNIGLIIASMKLPAS